VHPECSSRKRTTVGESVFPEGLLKGLLEGTCAKNQNAGVHLKASLENRTRRHAGRFLRGQKFKSRSWERNESGDDKGKNGAEGENGSGDLAKGAHKGTLREEKKSRPKGESNMLERSAFIYCLFLKKKHRKELKKENGLGSPGNIMGEKYHAEEYGIRKSESQNWA